jgi:hypothetical protein
MDFLLGLVGPREAERARSRLGDEALRPSARSRVEAVEELGYHDATPASVLLWLLEQDDPVVNALAFHNPHSTNAVKRDVLRGVPFGPGDRAPLERPEDLEYYDEPEIPAAASPHGVVGTLRRARTLRQARSAAMAVSREHWPGIAAADREEPLPGHARWALAIRIDCPPALREQFGSHPKFAHRLRQAGIVRDAAEYARTWRPARDVLTVLSLGRVAFPARAEEAAAALGPQVRAHLGGNPEAWAVCAQLLPTFSGTLPELVATSGAVAHTAA